jgi:predicted nuclease of predicted toxin-antitoxin system
VAIRLLIDECLPVQTRHLFPTYDARTVEFMGWKGLENGDLLAAAEREGFAVMLTVDGNMYRDNDLRGRQISVLVLPTNDLQRLRLIADELVAVIEAISPGEYRAVG